MTDYPVHPAAECFPMLNDAAYLELKAGIAAFGQKYPIHIDAKTKVLLDGRNRLRACNELGIEPKIEYVSPEDPLEHIIQCNEVRRHMDTLQRAAIAVELANLEKHSNQYKKKVDRPNGLSTQKISQKQAAEKMGVSGRSVRRAKTLRDSGIDSDRELFEAAKRGGRQEVEKVRRARGEIIPRSTVEKDIRNMERIFAATPEYHALCKEGGQEAVDEHHAHQLAETNQRLANAFKLSIEVQESHEQFKNDPIRQGKQLYADLLFPLERAVEHIQAIRDSPLNLVIPTQEAEKLIKAFEIINDFFPIIYKSRFTHDYLNPHTRNHHRSIEEVPLLSPGQSRH